MTGTALPTDTDSSYLLTLPAGFTAASSSSDFDASWQHPSADWVDQPMRRIKAATASIADPSHVYNYIFGGYKNDDSSGFSELWCFQSGSSDLSNPSWQQVSPDPAGTTPPVSYGHTVTLLSDHNDFRVVVIGGQSGQNTLNPLDEIYIFTPGSSDRCSGSWSTVSPDGNAPDDRQGHVALSLSSTEILIQGGASAGANEVYSDLAKLTFNGDWTSATWEVLDDSDSSNAPGPRYMHSAAKSGDQVLFAWGYGPSNPADVSDPGFFVFDISKQKWSDSYTPASKSSSSSNPADASNGSDSNSNGDSSSNDTGISDGSDSTDTDRDSGTSDGTPGTGQDANTPLHTPGVGDAPPDDGSDSDDDSAGGSSDDSNHHKHTGVILGSIASALIILVLGCVFAYWHRRRRQQTLAYYSAGGGGRYGDGSAGLIAGADSDGFEKALPARMANRGATGNDGPGVKGAAQSALASVLGVGRRVPRRQGTRFDILADEQSNYSRRTGSQVCENLINSCVRLLTEPLLQYTTDSLTSWPSRRQTSRGWQEAPFAEPVPEERRQLAPSNDAEAAMRESSREGLKIWDGIYGPAFSKVQASRSYMSHALGPWLGRSPTFTDDADEINLHDEPSPFLDKPLPEDPSSLPSPATRPSGPRWPSNNTNPFRSMEDDAISSQDHATTTEESYGVSSNTASTTATSELDSLSSSPARKATGLFEHSEPGAHLYGSTFSIFDSTREYQPLNRTNT